MATTDRGKGGSGKAPLVSLHDGVRLHPLMFALIQEIERQDDKHGPYQGSALGRSRLALATMEDEIAEARAAWRSERKALNWDETRAEVLQVAAVAMRTLRDAL